MSSEILAVLEYMEKEKGISRPDMIATIENAIKAAAERGGANSQPSEVRVEISQKSGALKAWTLLTVVESVSDTDSTTVRRVQALSEPVFWLISTRTSLG